MNKAYRLIWSDITHTWAVVAEFVKAKGKRASSGTGAIANPVAYTLKTLALSLAMIGAAQAAPPVNELPTGGRVTAGSASISQSGSTMTINQNTGRAAVNWNTFNVGSGATVNIHQPGSSSVLLNRVLSGNPSQIFGQINANGQVFLTNPNGIYFAPGSSLNVGGLVATTHSITDDDFMAGRDIFTRNGATGTVINDGSITADLNGYVALLAPEVRNHGVIVARLGTVALAAGEAYQLQFDGNNTLANIAVAPATIAALVENGNAVQAPGGLIILSAQALNHLQGGVVNNSGRLEANGLTSNGGIVRLEASDNITHTGAINVDAKQNSTGNGGTATLIADLANHDSVTEVNGSISARGGDLGGNGGFVETSGGRVRIGALARIDTRAAAGKTGSWLLDPYYYTIAASGGDETGESLSNSLLLSDRTITATYNINVNDSVTWAANTLTLDAGHDININTVMTVINGAEQGNGVLSLNTGASGHINMGMAPDGLSFTGRVDFKILNGNPYSGSDMLTINGDAYTIVGLLGTSFDASTSGYPSLQGLAHGSNMTGKFALGTDISASSITNFVPIGSSATPFTGVFDGLGHTISSLTVSGTSNLGLFGKAQNALIENVGLTGVTILGSGSLVGALAGSLYGNGGTASMRNTFASSTVQGAGFVGGLVGHNYAGNSGSASIFNSHASGTVSGTSYNIGGLVGQSTGNTNSTVSIENSSAAVAVSGTGGVNIGGLVGRNFGNGGIANITQSHATGEVNGNNNDNVGGLVGYNYANGGTSSITIENSYATGAVHANADNVGGLVGFNYANSSSHADIYFSFATGTVSGGHHVGGLVGTAKARNFGSETIDNAYATGKVTSNGWWAGGLVGYLYGRNATARVRNSYAIGDVSGSGVFSGGLVGFADMGTLDMVFATGKVTGGNVGTGGLIGYGNASVVSNAFATGEVYAPGQNLVGGLVGYSNGQTMQYVFATGNVTGTSNQGSLIGLMTTDTLQNYFATGTVAGSRLVGNDGTYTGDVTPSSLGAITRTYLGGDPTNVQSWAYYQLPTLFDKVQSASSIMTVSGNLIAWDIVLPSNSETIQLMEGSTPRAVNSLTIAKAGTSNDAVDLGTHGLNHVIYGSGLADPYMDITSGRLNLPNAPTLTMNGIQYTVINKLGIAGSSSGTDLQGLVTNDATKKYVLGLDIDASDTATWNAGDGFAPIGSSISPFKGTLDGLGHAVHHLTISRPATNSVGLFSYATGAALANLGLSDENVTGYSTVGGLAAQNSGSNISNVYVTGEVTGNNSGVYIGGLIGSNGGAGIIANTHVDAAVTGGQVGGMVGYNANGSLIDVFTTGAVTGNSTVGGLIGYNSSGDVTSAHATGAVTGAGGDVGGLIGSNGGSIYLAYATGAVTGGGDNIGGLIGSNSGSIDDAHASGSVSGSYFGNSIGGLVGRNSNSISNSYATGAVLGAVNVGGLVGYNVDGSLTNVFTTGAVSGNLNVGGLIGRNHGSIYDAYATGAVTGAGSTIGGLIGNNNGSIDNAYATGAVTGGTYNVGGLIGYNYGASASTATSISNSHASGRVAGGTYNVGGLVGFNEGYLYGTASISNSYASGEVTGGGDNIGGLIGQNKGDYYGTASISNSYASGAVTGGTYNVGGLVGWNKGDSYGLASIDTSHATGSVQGNRSIGGLIGYNEGNGGTVSISNSHASGAVVATGEYSGGLVGVNYANNYGSAAIATSYATGDVTGTSKVGGLVGKNFGGDSHSTSRIENSYASGAVSGTDKVGGLVGFDKGQNGATSTILDSHATGGAVSGNSYTGGLVGWSDFSYGASSTISGSYSTKNVTGSGDSVGGLVGRLVGYGGSATITSSYASGAVSGLNHVGGLVGYVWATNYGSDSGTTSISGSHATGAVTGSGYNVGGLVGKNYGRSGGVAHISSSYATGAVTGSGYSLGFNVGGLVGYSYGKYGTASISGSHATGNVSGQFQLGGLVGRGFSYGSDSVLTIDTSYATGNVTGGSQTGGLAGKFGTDGDGCCGTITISNSHATGTVSSTSVDVGGLVGQFSFGTMTSSYANGNVTGEYRVGGLVGTMSGSASTTASIETSYATGDVTGTGSQTGVGGLVGELGSYTSVSETYASGSVVGGANNSVGGLVGFVYVVGSETATISNSYASGSAISGVGYVGGLVGSMQGNVTISNSLAAVGSVTTTDPNNTVGGLVGHDAGFGTTVSNSFYDKTLNAVGSMDNGFGTAKTSAELGDIATFVAAGWNIAQDNSLTASAAPKLGWQSTGATTVWVINSPAATVDLAYTLSALTGTHAYTGTAYLLGDLWSSSAIFGGGYASWVAGTDYTFQYGGNTVSGFTNAATYSSIGISILRTGYQVAGSGNTAGTLTIDKAHLTVTADDKSRLYGEANPTFTQTISGFVNGETLATSGVTGTATGSSTAGGSTAPGRAVIVASASGLTSTNYDFTDLRDGWLTIAAVNGNEPVTGTAEVEPPPPPPAPPSAPLPTTESSPPPLGDAGNTPPPAPEQGESGGGEGFGAANGVIAVELVREPSVQESGVISVSIPKEMATAGSGFTFKLPEQLVENAGDQPISARLANGDPLPAWLTFDEQSRAFVATAVPDSAFPVQVVVSIGGTNVTIIISERPD